jgi:hypothetical protein
LRAISASRAVRFAAERATGLTVIVSGNANLTGATIGEGGPTLIGVMSNSATFTDELAHGLGNVHGGNLLADVFLDLNELQLALGLDLDLLLQEILRKSASKTGCALVKDGCLPTSHNHTQD